MKERASLSVELGRFLYRRRSWLGSTIFVLAIAFFNATLVSLSIGSLLIGLGEVIRLVSVAYAGPKTRSRRFVAEKLVIEGPYSIVRNPIYLGNFFIGLGFLITTKALFPYLPLVYIPIFFLYYGAIVLAEEDFLEREFGEDFIKYKREVPRFIPRFPLKWRRGDADFGEALRSEKSTFILILSWLLLTVVLAIVKSYW